MVVVKLVVAVMVTGVDMGRGRRKEERKKQRGKEKKGKKLRFAGRNRSLWH